MTEKKKLPLAVWVAIAIQCMVGTFTMLFNCLVIYAIWTGSAPSQPSVKDAVIISGFFLVGVICFISAFPAFRRVKASRFLPVISSLIVLIFFVDGLINELSFRGSLGPGFLTGWIVALFVFLFWIVLPSVLLSFGKTVNEYFGFTSEEKDSHLLEPPSPPLSF